MVKRRGNHEGGLYRRKDGRWCAQVSVGKRRLTKYARTPVEGQAWIEQTLARVGNGLTDEGTHLTLERFLET